MAALLMVSGCGKSAPEPEAVYNTTAATTTVTAATEATTLEKYVITCAELAYKALHGSAEKDLPVTMEVTDETMMSDVLRYDMTLADDHCVYVQMISTDLFELTVIRASGDNVKAVKDMLEARKTYLREQAAFYPSQVAAADATRVGEVNGVCYLICSEKSADIEKDLMFHILNN